MNLQIIFLGTAGSIPTTNRSLPSIVLRRKGELILFDAGEAVQRQMVKAGLGFNKKTKVFITHMHGDHIFGLPGLIQTMSLLDRTKKLDIYGPVGLEDFIEIIERTVHFTLTFPLEIIEIKNEGLVCEEKEYEVFCAEASHSIPSFAYSLVEKPRPGKFYPHKAKALGIPEGEFWSRLQHGASVKLLNGKIIEPEAVVGPRRNGRKIVYTGDSRFSESLVKLSENADMLIHDCTFDDELVVRAMEDGHSTPSQATNTAKKAKVKQLVLTHISARYKSIDLLLEQARKNFSAVIVAKDMLKINLPLPK